MDVDLVNEIYQLNPWLKNPKSQIINERALIPRIQVEELLDEE